MAILPRVRQTRVHSHYGPGRTQKVYSDKSRSCRNESRSCEIGEHSVLVARESLTVGLPGFTAAARMLSEASCLLDAGPLRLFPLAPLGAVGPPSPVGNEVIQSRAEGACEDVWSMPSRSPSTSTAFLSVLVL